MFVGWMEEQEKRKIGRRADNTVGSKKQWGNSNLSGVERAGNDRWRQRISKSINNIRPTTRPRVVYLSIEHRRRPCLAALTQDPYRTVDHTATKAPSKVITHPSPSRQYSTAQHYHTYIFYRIPSSYLYFTYSTC
jgi:hypothetical protein